MKKMKNKLDEMQEQKLLQIEHNGFWIAFWGIVISIIVQIIIFGQQNWQSTIGELVLLFLVSIYTLVACIKNGIWDRNLAPTPKTNIVISIISSAVVGILYFGISYKNYHRFWSSIVLGISCFIGIFLLTFLALLVCSKLYKKRLLHLESKVDDDDIIK